MVAIATQRARDYAECRYVLAIDGLPYMYSNDTGGSGSILGSDGSTWIGRSESQIGSPEVVGARTVKTGLILPQSIEFGGDPKGIGLDRSSVTFKIVDVDDTLRTLFATEDVDPDVLLQHIAPGTTALGTSVQAEGPTALATGTVDPRGQWIGLEKIGPSGQRRSFHCLPSGLGIGFDHQGDTDKRLPPTPISSSPVRHEGRMVTLWRIYSDPDLSPTATTRWYRWQDSFNAGDLVWWGTMADSGEYTGNRVWELKCYGPETLLEKSLGNVTQVDPYRISSVLAWDAGVNDQIFISFTAPHSGVSHLRFEGREWTSLTSTTKPDLISEIDTLISNTAAGTSTDYDTAQDFYAAWTGADDVDDPAGFDDGGFWIRMNKGGTGDSRDYACMHIAMHKRAWLALGYDPELQDVTHGDALEKGTDIYFQKLVAGEQWKPGLDEDTEPIPGSGYYAAEFPTIGLGAGTLNQSEWYQYRDNDGNARYYLPLFTASNSPVVLNKEGKQIVELGGGEGVLWEAQPTIPRTSEAAIDGSDTDSARLFVLRGNIRKASGSSDEGTLVVEEETEQIAVCAASWRADSTYGGILDSGSRLGRPIYIQHYLDPRLFGFPHKKLDRDWVGTVGGQNEITIQPLFGYATVNLSDPEYAHTTFQQILLGSGTSTGYSDSPSEGGVLDMGDNSPPGAVWDGDILGADMALGIPKALVDDRSTIAEQFRKVSGGITGDFNRVRLVYGQPYKSQDAIAALLKPRRLLIGLHGKKYGVYRLGTFSPADANVSITENDLYGEMGDPTSVVPSQMIRAHGAIDGARITYGHSGGTDGELKYEARALDYGARSRRGDLIEELDGRGLIPVQWLEGTPVPGDNWWPLFQNEWGRKAANFFAKRHFMLDGVTVSRPKGQDIMPGTKVLITNPWPTAPDGELGLTNRIGLVTHVRLNCRDHSYTLRLLIYAEAQLPPHFAPYLFITNINGTTLTYDRSGEFTGYAVNTAESEIGWTAPSWAGNQANGLGRLWYQLADGTFAQSGTGTVTSIDPLGAAPPSSDPIFEPSMETLNDPWSGEDGTATGTTYNSPGDYRDFDGTDDKIVYSNPSNLTGSPFTFIADVYHDTTSTTDTYLEIQATIGQALLLQRRTTNSVRLVINGSTALDVHSSNNTAPVAGEWRKLVVTGDGSTTAANYHIYLDGTELSYQTQTNGATLRSLNDEFTLGATLSGGDPIDGRMRNVRIYDFQMSQAQINNVVKPTGTLTLSGALSSSPPADTYTMLWVWEDFDNQPATSFVRDLYAPITDPDGTYGGTPSIGKKWATD